jgi:Alginate export
MRLLRGKGWAGAALWTGLTLGGLNLCSQAAPAAEPAAGPSTMVVVPEAETIFPTPDGMAPVDACPAPADGSGTKPGGVDWTKIPPLQPFPRLGAFIVWPTGPGYYSLLDVLKDNYRQNPPAYHWLPFGLIAISYFDADFRYLDKPDNTQTDWLDFTKRIHCGDNWMFSVGGEERIRYNSEVDSRLTGRNNTYELYRGQVYGDLWFRDLFRVYVEFIDARSYNQDLPPLATDINKDDFLNLFVDVKVATIDDHPVYVRGGRQEVYLGSQRIVSQTNWPNTHRNFDGVRGFYRGDKLDVDAFWTRPVIVDPSRFDSENDKATFAGLWTTYRPMKNQAIDLYYLYFDNATPLAATSPPGGRGGFDVNTFGTRYAGDYKLLLWDFEGMYQFGHHTNQETSAGAVATGLGIHAADLPMNPQLWVYNDWASGSHNPGHGDFGTFNQLFPNGHSYFGWTDLVGRMNIEDLNFQAWFFPTKWITVGAQYHILRLDAAKDALYSAASTVERVDPTGRAGTDVGDILTILTNFHLSRHSDVLVQYSHLYAGEFIKHTGSPLSPDFFYLQYIFRW